MSRINKVKEKILVKWPKKWRIAKKNAWFLVVFALFLLLAIKLIFFNEKRIGTSQHREESPFCRSDEECVLYDCTSCGNKFWVKQNIENNACDKQSLGVIGCKCEEGQCKRVLGK